LKGKAAHQEKDNSKQQDKSKFPVMTMRQGQNVKKQRTKPETNKSEKREDRYGPDP